MKAKDLVKEIEKLIKEGGEDIIIDTFGSELHYINKEGKEQILKLTGETIWK